jgi:hypothetical protein
VRFPEVLRFAIEAADNQSDAVMARVLRTFAYLDDELRPASTGVAEKTIQARQDEQQEWVTVIAPNQPAMYMSDDGPRKVLVKGHRYTPHGLMYQLEPSPHIDKWMVAANVLEPIFGDTKLVEANLVTGEMRHPPQGSDRASGASA